MDGEAQKRLGDLAREARRLLRLTQAVLAENAAVSVRSVQKLEHGDPVPRAMDKIEKALGWAPGRMTAILLVDHGDTPAAALRRVRQGAAETILTTVQRRIGPKSPRDPTVGNLCPACNVALAPGDYTLRIPLGPGADREMQALAREGLAYQSVAAEVHWACATGEDGEDDY